MKVKELIEKLQKYDPDEELHKFYKESRDGPSMFLPVDFKLSLRDAWYTPGSYLKGENYSTINLDGIEEVQSVIKVLSID